MTVGNPNAEYLLLLAVPIILFYFLKPRLHRVPVATAMFWDQVFQQHPARSPWQWIRRHLSLFLSLLFLLLLVGAALEAKLSVNGAVPLQPINRMPDLLPHDDCAGAVLPPLETLQIYFFGPKNPFLLSALSAQPNVEVRLRGETIPEELPKNGVVVLHKIVPKIIPPGRTMIVNPMTDCDLFRIGETLDRPFISVQKLDSPLLKFVRLEKLNVSGTRRLLPDAPPEDKSLTTILAEMPEGTPIYLHRKSSDRDVLVLNVDLLQSELPFRVAFPVLIANALNHYRSSGEDKYESDFRSASQWFYEQNFGLSPRVSNGSLGFYLTLSALCLTVLEWILYQRRWID